MIGAGPYGLSLAARAIERGIPTTVLGAPMGFWRENMPTGMFLRSDASWHLDASSVHTFRAYLEDRGLQAEEVDPIPIGVVLDYTDWFIERKHIVVQDDRVTSFARANGGYDVSCASGRRLTAERVVAAPGIARFAVVPEWARALPPETTSHTVDLVKFDELAGKRVLIVGGRQSAYEWAALIAEHGAERVDIVHRHDTPRFEFVSWKFVDALVDNTLAHRGWWRRLPEAERTATQRRFWEAGRLTLEPWLVPRLDRPNVQRWPNHQVAHALAEGNSRVKVRLQDGARLEVDRIVLATGYRSDVARVPYLAGVLDHIHVTDGHPDLDESFQSSLPGLYMTGFVATRDFGPFFGFMRAAPASARLIVEDLLR